MSFTIGSVSPERFIESLESRTLLANITFAVIGDFGQAGQGELDVANRVKSWNPAFIATVGDNNYPLGEASSIDNNVGQYYHGFIAPYKGTRGAGSADGVNHFFPALGNHDWATGVATPYLNYFTLPGNERYYTTRQGPVELFVIDSDPHDPDLQYTGASASTQNSKMGQWLKSSLAASNAPWKLVLFHHSPFTSGSHGDSAWMQWPFQQWGASAVLSGHDHDYERIVKNGFPYLVNGLGGAEIRAFTSNIVSGSAARFTGDYGAMKVSASDTSITFQFITRAGQTKDTYTLNKSTTPPPPSGTLAAPTNLTATASSSSSIDLKWTDNATGETGYKIERSTEGKTFYPLAGGGANMTSYRNTGLSAGKRYYYRVYAVNGTTKSALSNVANAVPSGAASPPPAQPPPSSGAPAAPANLSVTVSTMVANALNLSWSDRATNETGYKVERSTDGRTFYALAGGRANMTFYRNTGLTPGKRYYYRVYAVNGAGASAYSNVASAVVTPVAAAAPAFSARRLREDEAVWV